MRLSSPQDVLGLVASGIRFAEAHGAPVPELSNARRDAPFEAIEEAAPSLMMMYVWQNPVMLMAWSVVAFILGLVIYVTSPLRDDPPGSRDWRSAVFVIICGGLAALNFGFCSFWLYRSARRRKSPNDIAETGSLESADEQEVVSAVQPKASGSLSRSIALDVDAGSSTRA